MFIYAYHSREMKNYLLAYISLLSLLYNGGFKCRGENIQPCSEPQSDTIWLPELIILSRHCGPLGSLTSFRVLHHTLSALRSLMGKERRKGKGTMGALSFPFLLGHRFRLKWLVIWRRHPSERGYGRFFGHLCSGNAGTLKAGSDAKGKGVI